MSGFDDEIRGAMRVEDASLQSAGDEGLIRQVSATLRGRMRVWVLITWLATLFWSGVALWSAISFFRARGTRDWIMHASIFVVAALAIAMLKLWNLMEMNRSTHTREIKRVEMQIARLAARDR